jgi:hypothetical protein
MGSEVKVIQELLAHMGVPAEVTLGEQNEKVIIIETEQFQRRRAWIESWFTLVEQDERFSYFRERERGTGQTI